MQANKGFLFCCLLLGLGLCSVVYQDQWGGDVVSAMLWGLALGLTGLALLVVALVRVARRADLPWPRRLMPLAGWAAPLLACYTLGLYLSRIDHEPNWLVISNQESVGHADFEFKQDGRYKYATGSPLGLFYGYGRYVRHDSLLQLLPDPDHEIPADTLLVIRPYSLSSTPAFDSLARVIPLQTGRPYPGAYYIPHRYNTSAE